ncbi:hypothetical protein [Ornithinimicrobium tianjinense]|uniref:Uncharacterized protein n=1 Tax=Ornithinimicrobium tianjinense TaxID=1195761 RepID=A0A917F5F1_9MICO|nr:hypothetical protein [Ornithinimicrobium tianjinense]GGF45200.1 hypothetical protein GCM10011366_11140 [Ornithinimicrobium tianjinense]
MTTTISTTIDCDTCPVRGRHCGDCFVPVLGRLWLGNPGDPGRPDTAAQPRAAETPPVSTTVALDSDELAAVSAFVRAGLVDPEEAGGLRARLTLSTGYAVG